MNSICRYPGGTLARNRRRSRRLRKKLHLGEFRELGFATSLKFMPDLTARTEDAFWDAFIVECIEANGLAFGGAATGMVVRAGHGSASDEDREAVRTWLIGRPEVFSVEVGPLEDIWYPAATLTSGGTVP